MSGGTRGFIVFVVAVGAFAIIAMVWISAPRAVPTTPKPQQIAFRELFLDAEKLGAASAYVQVDGAFSGILYDTLQAPGGSGSNFIRLMTNENTPRDIRELLYSCRQRRIMEPDCHMLVTGHMDICHLLANEKAKFPCLWVERVMVEQ